MKQRTDFVSNSSSSSFIVISDNADTVKKYDFKDETVLIPCNKGNFQFGWQWAKYDDFWSKLNFAALHIIDIESSKKYINDTPKDEWAKRYNEAKKKWIEKQEDMKNLLIEVCKEEFNLNIEFRTPDQCEFNEGDLYCYIDHQSNYMESPDNVKMFDSKSDMINFLCNEKSFIRTGNDNDEAPDGWYEQ